MSTITFNKQIIFNYGTIDNMTAWLCEESMSLCNSYSYNKYPGSENRFDEGVNPVKYMNDITKVMLVRDQEDADKFAEMGKQIMQMYPEKNLVEVGMEVSDNFVADDDLFNQGFS